jgi:uncharacterized protein
MPGLVILLLVAAPCAIAMGYAAQRGSICAVRGVEAVIEHRSPRLFVSFLRASGWVALVSLPLIWLGVGDVRLASNIWPSVAILGGAFLFGVGAATNGGCSFGTLLRLAAGDLSFLMTLIGLSVGFALQRATPWAPDPVDAGPSLLAQPHLPAMAVFALLVVWALREVLRFSKRNAPESGGWAPEIAVVVMGVAGGVLYALYGSWMYTVALDRGLATMMSDGIGDIDLAVLFVSLLGGAALAARRMRLWRIRFRTLEAGQRLLAGVMMGFGAALVPGGNDALVLHAVPALSAHALPAYIAMSAGIGLAVMARKRVSGGLRAPNAPAGSDRGVG